MTTICPGAAKSGATAVVFVDYVVQVVPRIVGRVATDVEPLFATIPSVTLTAPNGETLAARITSGENVRVAIRDSRCDKPQSPQPAAHPRPATVTLSLAEARPGS